MSSLKIGNIELGKETFIIAEIASNHLGDFELAMKSLDAAASTGVDAVKFQLFRPEHLVTSDMPVMQHVPENRFPTQRERWNHMRLKKEQISVLFDQCQKKGVMFLCTPFDEASADFLEPLVPAFKLASGDATNYVLVDHVVKKGKPIIASTGLCSQEEVDSLVKRLPADQTLLLHCVGAYPTPDDDACLSLIPFYRSRYKFSIGYSDHTQDSLAPITAVAMGAVAIEKHFILDKSLPGGDRDVSLDPQQMEDMVSQIRRLRKMVGMTPRRLLASEENFSRIMRRSPYTRQSAKKGEILKIEDMILLRPEVESAHPIAELFELGSLRVLRNLEPETLLDETNSEIIPVAD